VTRRHLRPPQGHPHMPRSARLRRSVGLAAGHCGCGRTCPREGIGAAQCVGQPVPAGHAPDQVRASAAGIPAAGTNSERPEDPRTTGTAWVAVRNLDLATPIMSSPQKCPSTRHDSSTVSDNAVLRSSIHDRRTLIIAGHINRSGTKRGQPVREQTSCYKRSGANASAWSSAPTPVRVSSPLIAGSQFLETFC
jgi:hypothetical protein